MRYRFQSTFTWQDPMSITTRPLFGYSLPLVAVLALACDSDGGPTSPLEIQLPASAYTLTEGGAPAVIQVTLSHAPDSTVQVVVTQSSQGVLVTPTTLTFTEANWDSSHQVVVAPQHDSDLVVSVDSIAFAFAGSDIRSWVKITKNDDDVQTVLADATDIEVGEGQSVGLGIRLAFRPVSNVTVTVGSAAAGVASYLPSSRTFTPDNWSTFQLVTVFGTQDTDAVDDDSMVRLTGFNGADVVEIPLTVVDDD